MKVELTYKDVSDYFLAVANSMGDYLSNLKLQKLVYYTQAWHLAMFDSDTLFDEDFQAWIHGPVLVKLYNDYKTFGFRPIIREDLDEEKLTELELKFGDRKTFIDDIVKEYFPLSAYQLERLTHSEEPWLKARQGLQPDESSNVTIKREWMADYYSQLL